MSKQIKTISEKIAEATTMTVKVEFEMMTDLEYDKEAYELAADLGWIAKELAKWLEDNAPRDKPLHDVNGNKVGQLTVVYD